MDYNDKIFSVLRNFMEYGNYHGEVDKAVAAIRKSFPEAPKMECTQLFLACCDAYKDAIILVKDNLEYYSSRNQTFDFLAEKTFRKKHGNVPDQLKTWIIGWIYHWHHER